MANDGIVRIIDFGLARSIDITATVEGVTHGTPLYMSPEQASGKPVDFRTDIWSLGVVLYEMLAGAPPFRGGTALELMRAVVQDEPVPLREVRPGLPAEVEAIVSRALQKDPCKALSDRSGDGAGSLASRSQLWRLRRRRAPAGALCAVTVVILLLLGVGVSTGCTSNRRDVSGRASRRFRKSAG